MRARSARYRFLSTQINGIAKTRDDDGLDHEVGTTGRQTSSLVKAAPTDEVEDAYACGYRSSVSFSPLAATGDPLRQVRRRRAPFGVEGVTLPALRDLKELLTAAGVPRNDSGCHGAPTNQHGGHRSNPKHGRSPTYAEARVHS